MIRCRRCLVSINWLFGGQNDIPSTAVVLADSDVVDPETYEVKADGVLCDAPPATTVPLGKNYFVY